MPNPVVHFDVGCRDREKAGEFYSQIFGWTTSDYGPLSKKIDTGSAKGIAGHLTALGHEPHQYVMFYIEVEDIPATLEKVTAVGGSVVLPETPIPDGGHFAWFKDLDGNTLGLYKP